MPRNARIIIPGSIYHVTQRGNNRQTVFRNNTERRKYLYWMESYRKKYNVEILAYCLMKNHVHFIGRPNNKESFAKTFNTVHMLYSQYIHKRYETSGHLWQGRYYSCILWENHLYEAIRYVERNPVRTGNVKNAWDWPWSSAKDHIGVERGIIKLSDINEVIQIENWKSYLNKEDKKETLEQIRKETKSGRVWGPKEFVEQLEERFNMGNKLEKAKMGRPKSRDSAYFLNIF